jgi:hypothetical protein
VAAVGLLLHPAHLPFDFALFAVMFGGRHPVAHLPGFPGQQEGK